MLRFDGAVGIQMQGAASAQQRAPAILTALASLALSAAKRNSAADAVFPGASYSGPSAAPRLEPGPGARLSTAALSLQNVQPREPEVVDPQRPPPPPAGMAGELHRCRIFDDLRHRYAPRTCPNLLEDVFVRELKFLLRFFEASMIDNDLTFDIDQMTGMLPHLEEVLQPEQFESLKTYVNSLASADITGFPPSHPFIPFVFLSYMMPIARRLLDKSLVRARNELCLPRNTTIEEHYWVVYKVFEAARDFLPRLPRLIAIFWDALFRGFEFPAEVPCTCAYAEAVARKFLTVLGEEIAKNGLLLPLPSHHDYISPEITDADSWRALSKRDGRRFLPCSYWRECRDKEASSATASRHSVETTAGAASEGQTRLPRLYRACCSFSHNTDQSALWSAEYEGRTRL